MSKLLLALLVILMLISCQSQDEIPMTPLPEEILYYSSKQSANDTWQIFRKNLTSDEISTITNDPLNNYWWVKASPDDTQLLILRSPITSPSDQFDYANCEMIKSNIDGSNQEIIIADNQYDWFAFGNPHWHPEMDRIMLIAQKSNAVAPFHTYTVDINGNNPQQIIEQYSIDAHWNTEGDKITFIGIDEGGFVDASSFEVFTADYNHSSNLVSNVLQLTSDDTRNHDPSFSPDGSQIVFSSSNNDLTNADLISIDVLGNNRTELINDNGIHGGPLNWGADDKVYHHSIYIGSSNFTVNAYNTVTGNNEILLNSQSSSFISPFYIQK